MFQMELTPDLIGPPGPAEPSAGRRLCALALDRREKDRPGEKKTKKPQSPQDSWASISYIY